MTHLFKHDSELLLRLLMLTGEADIVNHSCLPEGKATLWKTERSID